MVIIIEDEKRLRDKEKPNEQNNLLSTLAKGLQILELLAEEGYLSVSDVAKALVLNRTSAYRYLSTLKKEGYVKQLEDSRYGLSYKIFELGTKAENLSSVLQEALPFMHKLASIYNETVNFACIDGYEVIHLEKVESTDILRIDTPLGSRAPLHCTALGKAILAFLPEDELGALLEKYPFKAYTTNTITQKETLLEELRNIREQGVAIDNEELALGLKCVGASILDRYGYPKYGISLSGIAIRMTRDRIERMKYDVHEISKQLSFRVYHN